jgi:DNA-binding MarR family transcriptional regulator
VAVSGDAGEAGEIVELVIALMGRFRDHFLHCISDLGLTPPQATALRHLGEPLSQRELASCLHYDASNITSIVDGLEQRGFVVRHIDPADRRIRRIVLTDEGRQMLARLHERLMEDAPVLDELDAAERRQFRVLLGKIVEPEFVGHLTGTGGVRA